MLRLEDQDAVAAGVGAAIADDLMADIAAAARSIGWIADGAWGRFAPPLRSARGARRRRA